MQEEFKFIVTEYMAGDNLQSLINVPKAIKKSRHTTPLDQKIDLLIQVTKGMIYIHNSNIMHRDLKPSNILVR